MTATSTATLQKRRSSVSQVEVVLGLLLLAVLAQPWVQPHLDSDVLSTWATMFVAIVIQSLPFLALGVVLSAVISSFVTERALSRLIPRDPRLAVPVAGIAGLGLPGCECAAVPIANSLMRRGVVPAVALTFLLAAPAVNPAVLVSTAVAFSGQPEMVLARFLASLATAVVVGWLWVSRTSTVRIRPGVGHDHDGSASFLATARHDFLQAAGYVVLGAGIAAAVNTIVPSSVVDTVAGQAVLGVVTLAVFAFVVALCSESDAFVAASLTAFSDTAKLVFLVVGPAMDIKLATQEAGQFGSAFAARFVPTVLVTATLSACLVGWLLL